MSTQQQWNQLVDNDVRWPPFSICFTQIFVNGNMEYLRNNQLQMKLCYVVYAENKLVKTRKETIIKLPQEFKGWELLNVETSQMLIQTRIKRIAAIRKSIIQFWSYWKQCDVAILARNTSRNCNDAPVWNRVVQLS